MLDGRENQTTNQNSLISLSRRIIGFFVKNPPCRLFLFVKTINTVPPSYMVGYMKHLMSVVVLRKLFGVAQNKLPFRAIFETS